MLSSALTLIHWLFRLSVRFIKGAPVETISVVFMTLLSQILGMLAFLLPLKIVMLLGSPRIPRFFPDVFLEFERNQLVLMLCGVALACFVLNIFVSKAIIIASGKGAKKLQAKAEKITLFKDQNEIASRSYSHYAEALASQTFAGLAITILMILYEDVAYFLLAYIAICMLFVITGFYLFSTSFVKVRSNPPKLIGNLNNVGFFAVFVFVVVDFLYMEPPAFFVAMFSMIMTRRLLGLLGTSINRILSLQKNQQRIDALFFHNKVYLKPQKKHKKSFWDVMAPEIRDKWLSVIFSELGEKSDEMDVRWLKLRTNNVIGLKVSFGEAGNDYLVRLFDAKAAHSAKHEASILIEFNDRLPAPEFIKNTQISDYQCHVFKITDLEVVPKLRLKELRTEFFNGLMGFKPPAELVQRYKRSKVMLWQRIDERMFERTLLIADDEQIEKIKELKTQLPVLLENASKLPLMVMTGLDANGHNLTFYGDRGVMITNWGDWTLEPIGYGLEFNRNSLSNLFEAIKAASKNRPELKKVNFLNIVTVVLLSELEGKFQGQGFVDSFELINRLLVISGLSRELAEDGNALISYLFDDVKVYQ